jgi:hypothetical protein
LGPIAVNSMQYGTSIMVTAPPFGDFYLLQFTLTGRCQLRQDGRCTDLPAGSVAVINPFRAFAKAWSPGTRQLLIRIDRRLLDANSGPGRAPTRLSGLSSICRQWKAWRGLARSHITSGCFVMISAMSRHT